MDGLHRLTILLAVAALAGCDQLPRPKTNLLPSQVSLLVERTDGRRVSVLLGLRRNGLDQLDVRLSEGMRVYDGRHVYDLVETPAGLEVIELVDGVRAELTAEGELVAVERGHAWFEGPRGRTRCRLETRRCEPAVGLPDLPLTHPGPKPGFKLSVSGGELRILLPTMKESLLVAEGIREIFGVQWVRVENDAAQPVMNRTFRGQATVRAEAQPASLDGDFAEWEGVIPTVVSSPWQLQSGARAWSGPRDGSFSIAATWSADALCFAGRVRDDAMLPEDRLVLRFSERTVEIPLLGPPPDQARLVPAWFGVGYEACVPMPGAPLADDLPFTATLVDADDELPPTRLATAPEADGRPLGHLLLLAPDVGLPVTASGGERAPGLRRQ